MRSINYCCTWLCEYHITAVVRSCVSGTRCLYFLRTRSAATGLGATLSAQLNSNEASACKRKYDE